MNSNKLFIMILCCFLLISMSCVSAEDNNTQADEGSFKYLQTVIDNAESGEIILDRNYAFGNDSDTEGILINKSITIDGNNKVLDGKNASRIFIVNSPNVVLKNINFINGNAGNTSNQYHCSGGAINWRGVNGTLANSTFINNNADNLGGAVYIYEENLTVENVTFINNSATRGGGIAADGANQFIYSSNFYNNTAYASAGAVYTREYNITIDNSDFINNTAVYGGALRIYLSSISNSNFINNTAFIGSAILGSELNITNSTFLKNRADSSDLKFEIQSNKTGFVIDVDLTRNNNLINAIYEEDESEYIYLTNVTYYGFKGVSNTGNETVKPVYVDVLEDEVSYNTCEDAQNVTFEVYDTNNTLLINQSQKTDLRGHVKFNVLNLTYGRYTVKMYHERDDYYDFISNETLFQYENILLSSEGLGKYYGNNERFEVKVYDNSGTPIVNRSVCIDINNRTYNRISDENGIVSLGANLNSGYYPVKIYLNESDNYTSGLIYSWVQIHSTVGGMDIYKVFRNNTQYYAYFLDSGGNLLENTTISFNINGVFYNRTTNESGIAKLNINLEAGEYILTAINPVTGEMTSNEVTVISRLTDNTDIEKYYRNDTQYLLTVLGDDGNPADEGEVVTFNINGMFYNRTTNESGIAKLNINLEAGEYIITAEYRNCRVSNNIKVLPILYANDLNMSEGENNTFNVKLVDGKGNTLANEKIIFNINGVLYNRSTNSSGIAYLNIRLMAGEYIITSSYNSAQIANTIIITG